jgi:hypothetical protein
LDTLWGLIASISTHHPFSPPLVFELGRGEVAERGVDALVNVDLSEKATQPPSCLIVMLIVGQVNFLFIDSLG